MGVRAHQRIRGSNDKLPWGASAHQSDGASIDRRPRIDSCLSNHGVLPLQASVVEHSDESRKTVTDALYRILRKLNDMLLNT